MLTGTCHCGALGWKLIGDPGSITACNCTICRRYGALWAYGWEGGNMSVSGPSTSYRRGPNIDYHFCPTCGCLVFYRSNDRDEEGHGRLVVNVRMADDPEQVAGLLIDHFDGLDTFDDLPNDGKLVRDMWF